LNGAGRSSARRRRHRNPTQVKWAAFGEQRRHEDYAAVKFEQKQAALRAKNAHPDKRAGDFVRRLRRVLDLKSREHGGTEGTYLRECFLNWDADCSGTIDAVELKKAIFSLGLRISLSDAQYLVGYYGGVESAYVQGGNTSEMTYHSLIDDVVGSSVHFLQPQPKVPVSARPDGPFQPVLRRFIKKVRQKLFTYITGKGENEQFLIRKAFLSWDKDASGKLDHHEFKNAMWTLNLAISDQEARDIIDCYDPAGVGIKYEELVRDVCAGVAHFTKQFDDEKIKKHLKTVDRAEAETHSKAHDDERMMMFMFTNRPLEKVPCKVAEEFKVRLKTALFAIMVKKGGTVTSILRDAFLAWDADSSGELDTREFMGACGRVGVTVDHATADQIVKYYDRKGEKGRFGDGEIHYMDLIDELGKTCLHFMATAKANEFQDPTKAVVVDTPKRVKLLVGQIRDSILAGVHRATVQQAHSRRTKVMKPRDLFLSTCVRLDKSGCGLLDEKDMLRVFRDIKATLTEGGMRELLIWYGVDGSQRMPYQVLCDECFPKNGVDTPTRTPTRTPRVTSRAQATPRSSAKKLARITAEKATIEKRLRELTAEARAL
jgi:Ca2+-binding EF-hand superfamily protein